MIRLHGHLKDRYGAALDWQVETPRQAVSALRANFPDFAEQIKDGHYAFAIGAYPEDFVPLRAAEDWDFVVPPGRDIHMVPVVEGEGPVALLAAGAAIVGGTAAAAGVFTLGLTAFSAVAFAGVTWGQLALFGVSLALSGVAQLLSPTPKAADFTQQERPESRPSFIFSGPVNVVEQGGPVPLVYGRMLVGSVVISSGLSVEETA